MKNIITLVLLVVLTGCAASGIQVSQNAALQFKEGIATEAQIMEKLGRPTSTTIINGQRLISYSGMQYQVKGATFIPIVGAFAGGADYTISVATYQIGVNGVLQKISYSTYDGSSRMGVTPAAMSATEPTAIK
jgi:hypothetical protein